MTVKELRTALYETGIALARDAVNPAGDPVQLLRRTQDQLELVRLELEQQFRQPGTLAIESAVIASA